MASWGLVTTLKAPPEKVLAFVAHHLDIGADHIALYFDDPESEIPEVLVNHPKVNITLCDDTHWNRIGIRPPQHQNRQVRNARDATSKAETTWLGNIDVDEFLFARSPLSEILAALAKDRLAVKIEPFEAMHDPSLPDDIYTARAFRGAIKHEHWPLRQPALGEYRKYIRDGMLSHRVGKLFFRTKVRGLWPRLHTVRLKGEPIPTTTWVEGVSLLHFHAQDRKAWLDALPFRLTLGAYQFRPELQAFLKSATPEEIDRFYLQTQVLDPGTSDELERLGRVLKVDLGLRAKVGALMAGMNG